MDLKDSNNVLHYTVSMHSANPTLGNSTGHRHLFLQSIHFKEKKGVHKEPANLKKFRHTDFKMEKKQTVMSRDATLDENNYKEIINIRAR